VIRWLAQAALALALLTAGPAAAVDGGAAASGEGGDTYYSATVGGHWAGHEMEGTGAGLPESLHVVEGQGSASYERLAEHEGRAEWELRIEVAERPHERVDAVYDLVLAVPLPRDGAGRALFSALHFGITAREGPPGGSVPMVYGGEKVVLKRNVALERAWLPHLVGAPGGLPALDGTGYGYTLWDTILTYDSNRSSTIQGWGTLRYETDVGIAAPDAADSRHAAYLITWIATLDPGVPPFTVRLDTVEPAP